MRDEILQQANIKDGFQLATANGETDALFIEPKQRLSEGPACDWGLSFWPPQLAASGYMPAAEKNLCFTSHAR